jgi:tRNA threonylcarbamoyladenosine biosynthesis protein TsaB
VTILAIDTTSEYGGVAIRSGGSVIAEISRHAPDGFAHVLFPTIEEVLRRAGISLSNVDCFAAANGPGSFTGVRVGLSAVKGLAEAMHKPAVGVSNLKALASFGTRPLRATVLDARRGQAYVAVYDQNLEPVIDEAVVNFSDWVKTIPAGEDEFITLAGSPFCGALPVVWTEIKPNLASAVASVAESSQWADPAALDGNYVRRSDAELFWKDDR